MVTKAVTLVNKKKKAVKSFDIVFFTHHHLFLFKSNIKIKIKNKKKKKNKKNKKKNKKKQVENSLKTKHQIRENNTDNDDDKVILRQIKDMIYSVFVFSNILIGSLQPKPDILLTQNSQSTQSSQNL